VAEEAKDKDEKPPPKDNPKEGDFKTVQDIINYQGEMTDEMFQFQTVVTQACLKTADDWSAVAEAFELQRRRAMAMIESCAWIARKSADNIGDLITAKFSLDDDAVYENDDDDDEDDDDGK